MAWMGRNTFQKVGSLDADLMAVAQAAPAGLVAATTTSTQGKEALSTPRKSKRRKQIDRKVEKEVKKQVSQYCLQGH